jgi:tetratricopeptide (TPR) repeat protein
MRKLRLLILTFLGVAAFGQRHPLIVDTETPEGQMLQAIGSEQDAAARIALLEQFVAKHGDHASGAWALEQLVNAYAAAQNPAKAAEAGEKLLAKDPGDLASAVTVLKAFEGTTDGAAVRKWSAITSRLAREELAKPKPAEAAEAEDWAAGQDYAKQVDAYSDYALLNQALKAADPKQSLELAAELEQRSPQSPYLLQAQSAAFVALRKAGREAEAAALAEKLLAKDADNEELLLVAADYAMKNKQHDKTIEYASRLVKVMSAKQKPEHMSDEDWRKRRDTLLGAGNWMEGVTYATQNKYAQADKSLRQALPLLADEQMKAAALFHLGVANFRLGESGGGAARIKEALAYSQQCAAIKSPYAAGAQKNVNAIRTKYGASVR